MSSAVPVGIALVAGGLATLNPCAFPLLTAFLSFYVGAEEGWLPRAPNRMAQGLLVGLLVTAGFLAVFAVVGLPIVYGASAVAAALPLAGIAVGLVLLVVGFATLAGAHVGLPVVNPVRPRHERRATSMLLFGAGYGIGSFGCTFPLFLTLLAAAVSAGGGGAAALAVFAAYAVGMAVMLMAISVTAAFLQQGLARRLGRLLPQMHRLSGGLLVLAGAYLTYYWVRVEFGPSATLASDPLVGAVTRFTARLQTYAQGGGALVVAAAALIVGLAVGASCWQWSRHRAQSPQGGVPGDH